MNTERTNEREKNERQAKRYKTTERREKTVTSLLYRFQFDILLTFELTMFGISFNKVLGLTTIVKNYQFYLYLHIHFYYLIHILYYLLHVFK